MKITSNCKVQTAEIYLDGHDLSAFAYWFGSRYRDEATEKDFVKWKRGEELALKIACLASRNNIHEDNF